MKEKKGRIEIIVGPMFSGKSEELIRRVKRALYGKQEVGVFKLRQDDRYSSEDVVSHDKNKIKAIAVENSQEILEYIKKNKIDFDVIAIDEVQFFDKKIIQIVDILAEKGYRVICAGLDMDYRRKPFENTANLLAMAESITKLSAVCEDCGNEATISQRFTNDKPSSDQEDIIQIGAKEAYAPRCRNCYDKPKKNN